MEIVIVEECVQVWEVSVNVLFSDVNERVG